MAISQRRIGWLLAIFALLLAVAAVRALQLATLSSGRLSSVANAEHVTTVTTPAPLTEAVAGLLLDHVTVEAQLEFVLFE